MSDTDRLEKALDEALAMMEAEAEAAEADAGFDAGEWSGPAHAEAEERQLREIAARYGLTVEELENALYALAHEGEPGPACGCPPCTPGDAYVCPGCGTGDPFDHSMACNAPVPNPASFRR